MGSKFLTIVIVSLITFYSTALGQTTNFTTNWNPTGEGCVDTTGFLSCYDNQGTKADSCMTACANNNKKGSSEYNTCVNLCTQAWIADNLGCWIQSCWNQVYSCAYQLTAMSYFDGNGLVQNSDAIPFYPPPSDASAGACSCNIGYVYGNLSSATAPTQSSDCEVIAGGDNSTLLDCECCGLSWPISNVLNVCPKSDLSAMGFQTFISKVAKVLAPSTNKCAILENGTDTCIKDYNFPYAGTMAWNPLSLPTGEPGTEALSNTAGNALTVFPSPVFTLSLLPSYTSTITPASFVATAAADTRSISGTSILGYPPTSTRSVVSTTSTTPSPTPTKSGPGLRVEGNPAVLALAVVLVVIRVL